MKLKPCPFCGREIYQGYVEYWRPAKNKEDVEVRVSCSNPKCRALGPKAETVAGAEKLWESYFSANPTINSGQLSSSKPNISDTPKSESTMQTQKTWQAQIFCGRRIGYSDELFGIDKIYRICQEYVDEIGWCVTVTPTMFIYKNGHEPGVIIGIVQYPRFPLPEEELKVRTLELAKKFLSELKQHRISICFSDETTMIESENI